jgi:hypothetical protein
MASVTSGLVQCRISVRQMLQWGHELPRHLAGSAAEVPLKAAAPITRQRGHNPSPDCNERRMANAKLSSQDLMPVLDQASRSAR